MSKWYQPTVHADAAGWVLVLLKPANFKDIEEKSDMNKWIRDYGLERAWVNNGQFWLVEHDRSANSVLITDRVLCWSQIPDLTPTILEFNK